MRPNREPRPRRIVVISDFRDGNACRPSRSADELKAAWLSGERGPAPTQTALRPEAEPEVIGGYLERLPLAAIRAGLCEHAEIWTHWAHDDAPRCKQETPFLTRRAFWVDGQNAPYSSNDILGHIAAFGAPEILCVWGLGVDETILTACRDSVQIYNSIDAPALRVPSEVSRHFDLILTGAEWQSREVEQRHPGMLTAVMPVGPEFGSPETFYPMGLAKTYDVIYVAAAQAYKRHDILFEALDRMPRTIKGLCVCGYGELAEALRQRAASLGINVDFVGPPGVDFAEVNRLMNLSRVGVVCGVDDGAPAILTEYMLAGLPVLANADLRCGLQYISPATGRAASAGNFHEVLADILARADEFRPCETASALWSWPQTVKRFAALIQQTQSRKSAGAFVTP